MTDTGYKPELDTIDDNGEIYPDDTLDRDLEDRPTVIDIPEAPILANDAVDDGFNVYIDPGLAMSPNGEHAIKIVIHNGGTLTAAQTHRLHVVLGVTSRFVSDLRQDPGYTS